MQSVRECTVVDLEPLNCLKLSFVLANTTDCNSQAIEESRVGDRDIGAVRFEGDTVIAILYCPIIECNMVGVYCVSSIGIGLSGVSDMS